MTTFNDITTEYNFPTSWDTLKFLGLDANTIDPRDDIEIHGFTEAEIAEIMDTAAATEVPNN